MFCVICFEDCDFVLRRRDKEINNKYADAEMEKDRVQRDKNGNMNNVAFYALSSSSPYGYLCSKLRTQKSKQRSHQFRTQNIKRLYTKHNDTYRLPYFIGCVYSFKLNYSLVQTNYSEYMKLTKMVKQETEK